jgi:protein SCO1/2
MRQIIFLYGFLFLAAGCRREPPAHPISNAAKQTYAVRGVVQSISSDRRHATIQHENIPGYMATMTMDFSVKDTNELGQISAGDEIAFTLVVTADDDWIENLRRTRKSTTPVPAPAWHLVEPELQVGDLLPDYEFASESGRPVRFSDFRGRAVAFTFFFTSCPLPDYCPRMNKNFFEARKILLADSNAPANWQLLSISFDSSFDTPQILAGYGKFYRGENTDRWLFAVADTNTLASLAPKVDLNFWRANGSVSHNLRTVVLDPAGKIVRQLDGNDWTPEQLADAIRAAAKTNSP